MYCACIYKARHCLGIPGGASGQEPACQYKRPRRSSLGWEDPLEEIITAHSSIAWRIPWTEEPGRLQYTGLQRVERN